MPQIDGTSKKLNVLEAVMNIIIAFQYNRISELKIYELKTSKVLTWYMGFLNKQLY